MIIRSFGDRRMVRGTPGADLILVKGSLDDIDGNGGSDTFVITGDFNRIRDGQRGDGALTAVHAVYLTGLGNSVTGGEASFTISGNASQTTVTLGSGDSHLTLAGTGNTVNLGLGRNVIDAGAGATIRVTAALDRFGGQPYHDTITLTGQHNSVVTDLGAGDLAIAGTFIITGGSGYGTFAIQDGTLVTDGEYNMVTIGSTQDFVDVSPGSGSDTVRMAPVLPFDRAPLVQLHLAGTRNVVTGPAFNLTSDGGAGSGTWRLNTEVVDDYNEFPNDSYKVTTGGLYNTFVLLDTNTNIITAGSGYDRVYLEHPQVDDPLVFLDSRPTTITLAGNGNLLDASRAVTDIVVDGGTGLGTFDIGSQAALVTRVPNSTITTGGSSNQFTLGFGHHVVTAGSSASVRIDSGSHSYDATITIAGPSNVVSVGSGSTGRLTVQGGTGHGRFTTGFYSDPATIVTGGGYNQFTLGGGMHAVTTGSDHATVRLNGSNADLVLAGSGNAVFLNSGASGTIRGGPSPDLRVMVAPGIGAEVIRGFLADARAVITLTGGAGGYTTSAQVVAALVSDGAGGSLLHVGKGSIDFAGVPLGSLHEGSFMIQA